MRVNKELIASEITTIDIPATVKRLGIAGIPANRRFSVDVSNNPILLVVRIVFRNSRNFRIDRQG